MIDSRFVYRIDREGIWTFKIWSLTKASVEEMEAIAYKGLPSSQAAFIYQEQLSSMCAALSLGGFVKTRGGYPNAWGDWMAFNRTSFPVGNDTFSMWVFNSNTTCYYCQEEFFSLAQSSLFEPDGMPMCEHHLNVWLLENQMKNSNLVMRDV